MAKRALDQAMINLLVQQRIITDPDITRRVTITFAAGEPITAFIEQFVDGDRVETIVRALIPDEA